MTGNFSSRAARLLQTYCMWVSFALGRSMQPAVSQTTTPSAPPNTTAQQSYLPATPTTQGTELDRVVAIVNGSVILDSDINQEMYFDSLDLNDDRLGPSNAAPVLPSRAVVLERLINRELILQQIQLEPPTSIDANALDKQIAELRTSIPACARFNCKSEAGWQAYLASVHLTEAAFRAHWKERLQVLAFTERRFSMGIRITLDQDKAYYDKMLLPQYDKAGVKPPPFEKIRARIEQVLVEQQVTALLTDWLHSLRAQGSVSVLHPGEEAP